MKNIAKTLILFILMFVVISFIRIFSIEINTSMFILSISIFIYFSLFNIFSVMKFYSNERKLNNIAWNDDLKIVIISVGKNIVKDIDNLLKYLSYPQNAKLIYYDDESTDNSFEKLNSLSKEFKNKLIIEKLYRDKNRILHPKGYAIEDAFSNYDADIFYVIDADTYTDFETFKKAVNILNNSDIEVLHLTRRNDLTKKITYRMADTEELLHVWTYVTGLKKFLFPGSSFLIKKSAAKRIKYGNIVFSEDNEIGIQIKQKRIKMYYSLILQTHEKAPARFINLIKQRKNWFLMGSVHFFHFYYRISIFIVILSTSGWLALLYPKSLFGIILIPFFASIFITQIFVNSFVGKKSLIDSIIDAVLYIPLFFINNLIFAPIFTLFASFFAKKIKFDKTILD